MNYMKSTRRLYDAETVTDGREVCLLLCTICGTGLTAPRHMGERASLPSVLHVNNTKRETVALALFGSLDRWTRRAEHVRLWLSDATFFHTCDPRDLDRTH